MRLNLPPSPSLMCDLLAGGVLRLSVQERQLILEEQNLNKRLRLLLDMIVKAAEAHKLSIEIQAKLKERTSNSFRKSIIRDEP
jgi:ATP-dependent Lon protease